MSSLAELPETAASDLEAAREQLPDRAKQVTVIEPRSGWRSLELDELWRYRNLIQIFLWRDVKAVQKQTVLGVLWLFISPLLSVVALTVVFGRMLGVPSDGFPYPIFVFAGQMLWNQFSGALNFSTGSVVANANFIQKVYFPRLLIPLTASLNGWLNLCIVFPTLLILMIVLGYPPSWTVVFAPLIIIGSLAAGLGVGFWLAPLNVVYRDVGRLVGFAVSLGLYVTPVIYPVSIVSEQNRWLLAFNPMAGYINAFRSSLYGAPLEPLLLVSSITFTLIVLLSGAFFFARQSGKFADVI